MPDQEAEDGDLEKLFLRHEPDRPIQARVSQDDGIEMGGMVGTKHERPLSRDVFPSMDGQREIRMEKDPQGSTDVQEGIEPHANTLQRQLGVPS
jgi:hypothetical protein